jgi:hypothetical protein
MEAALPHLCEGGVFGTLIDWRGQPVVHEAAMALCLTPLNLVVWTKTNAGLGSLYRSQFELLPLFKKGAAPHINNIELGRRGRWRSARLGCSPRPQRSPHSQARRYAEGRANRPHPSRRHRPRSIPRLKLDVDRSREDRSYLPRDRTGPALCGFDCSALRGRNGQCGPTPRHGRNLRGFGD